MNGIRHCHICNKQIEIDLYDDTASEVRKHVVQLKTKGWTTIKEMHTIGDLHIWACPDCKSAGELLELLM